MKAIPFLVSELLAHFNEALSVLSKVNDYEVTPSMQCAACKHGNQPLLTLSSLLLMSQSSHLFFKQFTLYFPLKQSQVKDMPLSVFLNGSIDLILYELL